MKRLFLLFLISISVLKSATAQEKTGTPVDIVFCLDLSSSSNGLIDHLRNNIWDYWEQLTHCKPTPNYRIGVVGYARYSYGKPGYAKVIKDLTTDFDQLSYTLYRIPSKIDRGEQFVGAALKTCMNKVSWSQNPDAVKIVFLIGNGDVTTGKDDIDDVLEKMMAKKILVNTVYCTVPGEKKAVKGWERIAMKNGGFISTINIRNKYFDRLNGFDIKKFRTLNKLFNNTYLYYGTDGRKRFNMLNDADNKVYVANTEGYRYRSLYKVSDDFQKQNHAWDLVDLYYRNPVGFTKVDRKTLNDTCRTMNDEQLKAYIIFKKYERRKYAALITEMLIDKELKDREEKQVVERRMPTLDIVTMKMLNDILISRGFTFNNQRDVVME